MNPLRICVMALGRIGLPTASLLAQHGHRVHGVDIDAAVVDRVSHAHPCAVEPELDALVRAAVQSGNLTASTSPVPADVFIVAVPTPLMAGNEPDLTHVFAAAEALAPTLDEGGLVVLESTVPVGTTHAFAERLAQL